MGKGNGIDGGTYSNEWCNKRPDLEGCYNMGKNCNALHRNDGNGGFTKVNAIFAGRQDTKGEPPIANDADRNGLDTNVEVCGPKTAEWGDYDK